MAANDHDTLALRLADILRLLQHGERPTRLQLAERDAEPFLHRVIAIRRCTSCC